MWKFSIFILVFKFLQCFSDPNVDIFDNNTANELNNLYEELFDLITKVPDAAWMIPGLNNQQERNNDRIPIKFDLNDDDDVNKRGRFNYRHIIELNRNSTDGKCNSDLMYLTLNIKESWAVQMLDAAGKLPSGILRGNRFWMGDFSECRSATVPLKIIENWNFGNFRGEYCYMTWNIAMNSQIKTGLSLQIGICVPDSCTEEILLNNLKGLGTFLSNVPVVKKLANNVNVTQITCQSTKKWEISHIAYMCVLGVFAVLIVIGTLCDVIKTLMKKAERNKDSNKNKKTKKENFEMSVISGKIAINNNEVPYNTEVTTSKKDIFDSEIVEFFICFSVYTNGAKICNTTNTANQLNCLHGIRFLSMSWIILGHTFLSSISVLENMLDVLKFATSFSFQFISQGTLAVDTFFLLSGLLLSYLFLKRSKEENEKFNWIYYYVHRFWRLTPVLVMVLGFHTVMWVNMGTGPFWPKESENGHCKKNWWWNLLYIQNFKSISEMCMGWTWYLANDMQFYIISPLFLILLWKFTTVGIITMCIILGISFAVTIVLSMKTMNVFLFLSTADISQSNITSSQDHSSNYFDTLYDKPWCRIGPYLIGIFTGYALCRVKYWKKYFDNIYFQIICWIIAVFFGTSVVFGVYKSNMGTTLASIYNGFSRTTWSIAVAWIVFACVAGFGGIINRILSWNMWIPLSRLTYAAYLIHPLIISAYYSSVYKPLHFTLDNMIMIYFGFLLSSYLAAFVVSIAFESPMMALEKFVLGRFSKKTKL